MRPAYVVIKHLIVSNNMNLTRRAREIYDPDVEAALSTFIHEVVEIKLRSALRPYRILVNKLIEGYQEIVDGEKDRFIESLKEVFKVAKDSPLFP